MSANAESEQGDEKKIVRIKSEKQPQSEDPEFSWLELSAKELPVRSVDNHWIKFWMFLNHPPAVAGEQYCAKICDDRH